MQIQESAQAGQRLEDKILKHYVIPICCLKAERHTWSFMDKNQTVLPLVHHFLKAQFILHNHMDKQTARPVCRGLGRLLCAAVPSTNNFSGEKKRSHSQCTDEIVFPCLFSACNQASSPSCSEESNLMQLCCWNTVM